MKTINTVQDMRDCLKALRREGKTVGLVPTMGYLHDGHLSLVEHSKQQNDVTVVSIFVNPTQFGPGEDLDSYPRDLERDQALLESKDTDYVFFPPVDEMYPQGYGTYVNVESSLTKGLCGASRPGHFKGVTTVVSKLLNIVQPDRAYFGQKDAQQVAVIRRMVRDLNMPVEIVPVPIVREPDGLAMSSRNAYLDETQRQEALVLSKALKTAERLIRLDKISKVVNIIDAMTEVIQTAASAKVDYIEIVDYESLEPVESVEGHVLIALAVYVGPSRLIDNMVLEV